MKLTPEELEIRLKKFCLKMNETFPGWSTAVIISKVNQYYFTGTMQDGMLLIKNDATYVYFVRQSFERAVDESPLKNIYKMNTYRDAADKIKDLGKVFIEAEIVPYATIERLKKYFHIESVNSLDVLVRMLRAVKSPYELYCMEESGKKHHMLLNEVIPTLLKEGMTEAEFYGSVFEQMIKNGYQGLSRFHAFGTELKFGQIGFGVTSLYPSSFDGPSGGLGMSPAVPLAGNPNVRLKKGDTVLVDLAFGVNGYHTDKTQIYIFGAQPSEEMIKIQRECIEIEQKTAAMLVPGAIPSQIYNTIMSQLSPFMRENFMGFGQHQPKFIGHGIGLTVDEMPVIADRFDMPLEENMTLAIEPKKGLQNVGMIGVEDTYVVTKSGGRCITGKADDIIAIK